MTAKHTSLLRRALAADALASGVLGIVLIVAASPIAQLFGLPASMLSIIGVLLLPWTAWTGWLAWQAHPPRVQVWSVIGINALWVIDSVVLLMSGWVQPTAFGSAFIVTQAVAVGVLAELQYIGVRRAATLAV
jgi:hypothetical protein